MGKHLVLVGGGHAHMVTLANLDQFRKRGHQVTVIGPSEHHYYSGMGPGMLGGIYTARQIRFATRQVVEKQGAVFIKAAVTHIDAKKQTVFTQDGLSVPYDVLSFNAGSYVPADMADGSAPTVFKAKPIEKLRVAQQQLVAQAAEKSIRMAVVGGGAAAVEIAGNAWRLLSRYGHHGFQIKLFTRGRLLGPFPRKVRAAGLKSLQRRDIQLIEDSFVTKISANAITLEGGQCHAADLIFLATGVRPSPIFSASGLATGPQGGLRVNAHLQSIDHANIFGGGDCIYFQDHPLDKVGVYAVRQNPILYHNLMACLEGTPLAAFSPGGDYLLILNMGDGTGLYYKNGMLLKGRLAFWIKDYIDRRFMRRFQALENDKR